MKQTEKIEDIKEQVEKPEAKLVEVTTQTAPMVQNKEGKIITEQQVLIEIMNKLDLLIENLI